MNKIFKMVRERFERFYVGEYYPNWDMQIHTTTNALQTLHSSAEAPLYTKGVFLMNTGSNDIRFVTPASPVTDFDLKADQIIPFPFAAAGEGWQFDSKTDDSHSTLVAIFIH